MNIIREGKTIELTAEEVLAVKREEHRKEIMYAIEDEVAEQEAEGWISFDSWKDWGDTYSSADDARADFIELIVEHVLEQEDTYDHDPNGYRANVRELVGDFAVDMEYDRIDDD